MKKLRYFMLMLCASALAACAENPKKPTTQDNLYPRSQCDLLNFYAPFCYRWEVVAFDPDPTTDGHGHLVPGTYFELSTIDPFDSWLVLKGFTPPRDDVRRVGWDDSKFRPKLGSIPGKPGNCLKFRKCISSTLNLEHIDESGAIVHVKHTAVMVDSSCKYISDTVPDSCADIYLYCADEKCGLDMDAIPPEFRGSDDLILEAILSDDDLYDAQHLGSGHAHGTGDRQQ